MDYRLTLVTGLLSAALLGACASTGQRIDRQAHAAGLSREIVTGSDYRHIVYDNGLAAPAASWPNRLVVFLDGDGRPWSADGQRPSADPTTRNPIALQLLTRTQARGIYVSRPCYQEIVDEKCAVDTWTNGRYAAAIADSIAAVIGKSAGSSEIVLIGYSGGGALAALVAERISNVAAVITIAANLDTDAWTRHHGYLPLDLSLNPALSERDHPWSEFHLQGARDTVVPPATTAGYFARYPNAQHWTIDDYDHVCCWTDGWPELLLRIQKEMN
jgi:pimeloyl-ACP methyl ester carboxylesterase